MGDQQSQIWVQLCRVNDITEGQWKEYCQGIRDTINKYAEGEGWSKCCIVVPDSIVMENKMTWSELVGKKDAFAMLKYHHRQANKEADWGMNNLAIMNSFFKEGGMTWDQAQEVKAPLEFVNKQTIPEEQRAKVAEVLKESK